MKTKRQLKLRRVQRPERKDDDLPRSCAKVVRILDANPIPTVGRYVYDPKTGKLHGPSK